jgi:cobalt/nickel transport system permease protein
MSMPEPRRSQALLVAGAVSIFALSALADLRALAVAAALALLAFRRGAGRELRRVALAVAPVVLLLAAGSWAWLRLLGEGPLPAGPFLALALRTVLIAFVTFSVLRRVELLRALAPFPSLTRLLVLCLAQIHALRRITTESALGLRSRMARRPGTREVVRNAGGVTATLVSLSARNARDAADAMRSRGF